MLAKIIILCSVAAAASAITPGYVSYAYALGSQAEHTIRGYGGLSSVSKQAKAIDSPYATVRKTDFRVTNDAAYATHSAVGPLTYAHHGHAYAAPALAHHGYHTQALTGGYHAPTIAHGYATAPAITHGYHSPAGAITYAHRGYSTAPATYGYASAPAQAAYGYASAPAQAAYGYASAPSPAAYGYAGAPIGYTTRGVAHHAIPTAHLSKGVVSSGLGVAYSPATSVATSTFHGHGVHYGY